MPDNLKREVLDFIGFIKNALNETGSFISVITKIELLGWQAPQRGQFSTLKNLWEIALLFR
ncbi:MAG: hypothetical protein SGI94_18415 [Saprospiraceae bacterium]|nr:hypothetical protein [Saprospiraceae bacterium]